MNKNFAIGQSNELVQNGTVYDLHNLFDFAGMIIGSKKWVRMLFEPNAKHGKGQRSITLDFADVDYLELSSKFGSRCIPDLDEVGYKSPGDQDDEWLTGEQQATSDDHLFFRFGSEDYVRIHCKHVDLRPADIKSISDQLRDGSAAECAFHAMATKTK